MLKQLLPTSLFLLGCSYLFGLPAIAQVNSITFNSSAVSPPIALIPNTALPSTVIGTVTVKSDSINGFIVSAESTYAGSLKRSTGETIAYTLTYNGIEQDQLTIKKTVENTNSLIADCADQTGCNREIKIAISQVAIAAKPAGTYSDLLTFTLVAK